MIHSAGGVKSRFKTPIENVSDADWRAIQAVNGWCFQPDAGCGTENERAKKENCNHFEPCRTWCVPYWCSNGTAKAAQIGLVKQLASELGQFGITVNSVAPGFMPTSPDYIKQWNSYGAEKQNAIVEGIAMRRIGKPDDIANAVIFFSSDLANWVTGQTLAVTGGP